MKKLLWILSLCMITIMIASVCVSAEDYEYTGWSFDEATGTLTINTEYWMPDFEKTGVDAQGIPVYDTPWKDFKDSITTIAFQESNYYNSISVGNGAFCGLSNLTEVRFDTNSGSPYSGNFGNIGEEAFYGDANLSHFMEENDGFNIGNYLYVTAEDNETIGARAFSGCTALCFTSALLYPSNHMSSNAYSLDIGPEAFFGVEMGDISIGGFFSDIYEADEAFTGMHCNSISIEFTPEGDHDSRCYYDLIDGNLWAMEERIEGPDDPEHQYETIPWQPAPVQPLHEFDNECDVNGHNKQYITGTAPTCTESGTSDQCTCLRCGKTLEYQQTIPALDHDWSDWTVSREPTTELEGEETRTCSRCDAVETRPIDKLLVVVAKIGNTEYHSLQAAVTAAANGDVIVVQTDLEENITIPQGKDITIDLNGHKIHNVGAIDTITNEGELLVVDEIEAVVGFIENDEDNCVPIRNNNSLELRGGTVSATGAGSAVINNGTLSVTGAVITADSEDAATIVNRKNANNSANTSAGNNGNTSVNNTGNSNGNNSVSNTANNSSIIEPVKPDESLASDELEEKLDEEYFSEQGEADTPSRSLKSIVGWSILALMIMLSAGGVIWHFIQKSRGR